MASGDITVHRTPYSMGGAGALPYNVNAGTLIFAGDPVQMALAGTNVFPAVTSTPVAGTSYYVGIATTNSTNSTTAVGSVTVAPLDTKVVYLANPDVAATWNTQALYDALVGSRVLLKNSVSVTATPTAGTYTLLAADSANNGCVVVPLNIFKTPGKVAFRLRAACDIMA